MRTDRIIRLGVLRLALWRVPGSLWMLLGFLVAWVVMVPRVHAETIAATSNNGQTPPLFWKAYASSGCNGGGYSTPSACIKATVCPSSTTLVSQNPDGSGNYINVVYSSPSCNGLAFPSCPAGSTVTGNVSTGPYCSVAVGYTCPANEGWTLSGNTCTRADCPVGTSHAPGQNGACKAQCLAAGTVTPGVTGQAYVSQGGSVPNSLCLAGCEYSWTSVAACTSTQCGLQIGKAKGTSCSPTTYGTNGSAQAAATEPTAAPTGAAACIQSGQGFGTVNGVVVCTGKAETVAKQTETTKASTGPNGTPTTTTETRKTVCVGSECTTTTTVVNSGGGSGGAGSGAPGATGSGTATNGTTTGSTGESREDFCKANPQDKSCAKEAAGAPATVAGLYTKGSRTVGDALADFRGGVLGSPIVSAATGYLAASIPSGTCSGLSSTINVLGHAWTFDPGQLLCGSAAQSIYSLLGLGVLLAAGWVAFRIAIL